ncbi:MAG TPA: ATP-binding protein [Steroidobacteraceae bacterium]|nr:ATP-binding protein [Steroidobacteraceae bacterium]
MGRLFWKFFLLIFLAQLTAVVGVGQNIWIHNRTVRESTPRVEYGAPAEFLVGTAAAALESGGTQALRELLQTRNRPAYPVYAVDESNHELLGREVSDTVLQRAHQFIETNPASHSVRRLTSDDGHRYLLFAPVTRSANDRPSQNSYFPMIPTIATLIGSLVCAALLARYLSKPIRNLRSAFDRAASGDLNMRVGPRMAKRNDELANLGRDFDRMAAQLQSLLQNQRRLFHDVSHELRSPLARLQIAAGLARQHPDTVQTSVERIERECRRIDELVGELLTLSKLETGVIGAADEKVDLSKLVADIVADARFESNADQRRITYDDPGPVIVRGQAELLHRAIENVVRNALKHTPESSAVAIEIVVDSSHARITIDDAGSGVAEQELEAIFQPFFRGGGAADTHGHGLGLSIARQVVAAHSGTIRASNRATGGLRVEISLPCISPEQPITPAAEEHRVAVANDQQRVLGEVAR